jgi:hypothetical protein
MLSWLVLHCACPLHSYLFLKGSLVDPRVRASYLPPLFRGVAKAALYCAHRTSTVSSCAFCEQEGHLAAPPHPSKLARYLSGMGAD